MPVTVLRSSYIRGAHLTNESPSPAAVGITTIAHMPGVVVEDASHELVLGIISGEALVPWFRQDDGSDPCQSDTHSLEDERESMTRDIRKYAIASANAVVNGPIGNRMKNVTSVQKSPWAWITPRKATTMAATTQAPTVNLGR